MSREQVGYELGQELAQALKGVTDENRIKVLAIEAHKKLQSSVSEGSFRAALTHARKAIEEAFPTEEAVPGFKPGYYWTDSQKGKIERFEHLALYYLSTTTERWEVSRIEHEKVTALKPQPQPELQPQQAPQITLEDMNISQLGLDSDTQQIVENALNISGISLADFIRKACQIHAKTVTGKAGQYESDLTAVATEKLLSSPTYKTHPGRAEELTRRAIYALETHNNNCTEKSQKWMITQTAIQSLTGSKPATIKVILERYQTRLEDHNGKHKLTPYDNRKPGRKIEDEINLAVLVPDGFYDSGVTTTQRIETTASVVKPVITPVITKANINKKDIQKMPYTASFIDIQDYLSANPGKYAQTSHEGETSTYARINDDRGFMKAVQIVETGELIEKV